MSRKSRGINAERDLIHKFWKEGWAAMRAAGSGSSQFPSPDVLAGNNIRKLAIECKLTTSPRQYFTKKEVNELQFFSEKFGAEPWFAVKFFHEPWYFFTVEDMKETGVSYAVTVEQARSRGVEFKELLE
ncbi:Holliday junction resolvase [Candidatus Woesearchaeota archaeon]|nr:Holliday junction resolvase [Candidatus Woesearchaeota archaeon]